MILEEQPGKESHMTFCSMTPGIVYHMNAPEASRRGRTLLRTRRIICLTCVQPHIPKSMGKLKDGHRIFNLTRQMKGKPCSCHISLTGTLTVSYCTLLRKILLCPINWGTQWTIEISSNEWSAPMAIEKNLNSWAVLELRAKQHCQFSLFTVKMGQIGWIGSAIAKWYNTAISM